MHVGQPVVAALELERQTMMVNSQAMQDRGVQVVHMDGIASDVVAVIVGLTMCHPATNSSPCHPDRETARMVIAAIVRGAEVPLTVDGPSELATPDDQRVFEQTSLFQVANQCRTRLVDIASLVRKLSRQVRVLVPTHVEQLNEPDTSLGESTCQ